LIDHGGSQAALGLGQRTLIFSSKKKRPMGAFLTERLMQYQNLTPAPTK